jgi:transposase
MAKPRKYPEELIERGVRLALESDRPVAWIARDLGVHEEVLRRNVRRARAQGLGRGVVSGDERQELERLRRENAELRRANEILKAASAFFATELDARRPR